MAFASVIMYSSGSALAQADPCETQSNTIEINACAKQTLATSDKALNETYQKVLKSMESVGSEDKTDYVAVKRRLAEAQRAWAKFRDADCKAKLKLHEAGTIRAAIYLGCLAERTDQRTKELVQWSEQ